MHFKNRKKKRRGGCKQNRGSHGEKGGGGEKGERERGTVRGEHEAACQALLGWGKKMGKQLGGLKTGSG